MLVCVFFSGFALQIGFLPDKVCAGVDVDFINAERVDRVPGLGDLQRWCAGLGHGRLQRVEVHREGLGVVLVGEVLNGHCD
eukprot:scaffold670540_cov32-Prasinocladus_malaysianus.AAC.1